MALWLEEKYVNRISYKLDRFKKRGPYLWNFRCPFCGDSKRDKSKTRGYIYKKKDVLFFHCHNCHESMFFGKFMQRLDVPLHKEYTMEKFLDSKPATAEEPVMEPVGLAKVFKGKINLPSIKDLPFNHFAKKFILDRKIPVEYHSELYYAECFKTFIDELVPDNEKKIPLLEKRIILPFYDEKNNLLGIQGRALFESKLKYITILISDTNRKVYGLSRLDTSKRIFVFEGPFDSMFVPNSLATMDSALFRITDVMGLDNDYVFVYDNEKRNPQIISNMRKTIELGRKVFIWPTAVEEKDINDLILSGKTENEILEMLNKHTYEGMQAKLRFDWWRK